MSNPARELQISHIPLARIDLGDTRYRISSEDEDITALAQSIKETGLTSLPIVRPPKESDESVESGKSYIVVSGFKRIKALIHNGYTGKVVCQTYPKASETDCAIRAISDNAFQRQLTPAELIQSVRLLGRYMEPHSMAEKSLIIFNTRFNPGYIKDLLKIGDLPKQAFELMDTGKLSIKSAKKISRDTPALARCFISLFSGIKASSSKQMEIITNFLEIAARENLNPTDLYQEKGIQEILFHDSKDFGFKGNLLRNYLTQRRFPFLEKKRQEVQEKINSLKLSPGVKLAIPENFESTAYSLFLEFKTPAEFETRVASLGRISTHPALEDILKR